MHLAFVGIWKRFPADSIVDTLTKLRAKTHAASVEVSLFAHVFSDTVAIGATAAENAHQPGDELFFVMDAIVHAVRQVISSALRSDPPLIFRGCMAIGDLIATQDVLVGEAVDDAAEFFEKADAAVIWLTPKANDNWVVWTGSRSATILYDVPLTTGSTLSTRALNPLTACVGTDDFPGGEQAYAHFKELTQKAF